MFATHAKGNMNFLLMTHSFIFPHALFEILSAPDLALLYPYVAGIVILERDGEDLERGRV